MKGRTSICGNLTKLMRERETDLGTQSSMVSPTGGIANYLNFDWLVIVADQRSRE